MTTRWKIKAVQSTGAVAIYTVDDTAIDDMPFTAPRAHLSRVGFHSDLDYLGVQSIHTGTLSLPSRSGTTPGTYRHDLFAHGLGYQPLVLGHLVNYEGYNTPLLGTTPIRTPIDRTAPATQADMRTVQLGADSTSVYLHEYMMLAQTSLTYPAVALDWRVMVTTRNLDLTTGNNNTVSHTHHALITTTRVVLSRGKFDSDRTHIKKVATGGVPVCIGPSVVVVQQPSPSYFISWKWSVNGQTKGSSTAISAPTNTTVLMDAA